MTRILMASCCAALMAAIACSSGAPTAPSTVAPSAAGATILGTVVAATPGSASTVTVSGTTLSSAVDPSGSFRLGGVPPGNIELAFSGSGATSTVSLANVNDQEVIELQVSIAGSTATTERGKSQGKVLLCHRTGNDAYHTIDVSVNAEPAHRAHGDATPGEPVPGHPSKVFDKGCLVVSPLDIEKFTNGQHADQPPGPTIPVGSQVSWTYVVTNTSALTFGSVSVTDDRGVAVACPRLSLAPGASMTCTGSGVAMAGPYRNVGTAAATVDGIQYTDSDASHYFGGATQ